MIKNLKLLRSAALALSLVLVGLLGSLSTARADLMRTYALAWSGASFSNSARATGRITLDLTTLPNPTLSSSVDMYGSITSLSVTVTGASVGNGTWTLADLPTSGGPATNWWTAGAALDMNTQLLGQATSGNAWGTPDGSSGDFNLFFSPVGAPLGTFYFTLTTRGTDNSLGDSMLLTSFAPVTSVPEPGSLSLLALGLVGLAGITARRGRT